MDEFAMMSDGNAPAGFARRRPADWEPIAASWLVWPTRTSTWPGRIGAVQAFYQRWIKAIVESTPVMLLVDEISDVPKSLADIDGVTLLPIRTNDAWIRDFGPQWVWRDRQLIAVGFEFNSWGGQYPPWDDDNAAARQIAKVAGVPFESSKLVLEGGGIECDGLNRAMINQSCLIDPSRNPGATQRIVAEELYRTLGIDEIAWFDTPPVFGDDTGGHVDQLARFVSPQTVVVASGHEDAPEELRALHDLRAQIRHWAANSDPHVEIAELPATQPRMIGGQIVPQSYCNYQRLGPNRILIPTFGDPSDEAAVSILSDVSGAACEGIDCRDMVYGLGALHCASNEQPAAE